MEVSLATVPCLIRCSGCLCADGSSGHTYIPRYGVLLVIERAGEGQSLSVSASDCIRMRNNEMLYDFVNVE